jgi:hypothetical protein
MGRRTGRAERGVPRRERIDDAQLAGWIAQCPETVLATPPGRLATAVLTASGAASPAGDASWRDAVSAFRAAGDIDGELAAIMQFGYVAWLRRDAEAIADLGPRVQELAATGNRTARALSLIGTALGSELRGHNDQMLAALDAIPAGALTSAFDGLVGWWRAQAFYGLGNPDAARIAIDGVLDRVDDTWRPMIDYVRWTISWQLGRIDEVLAATRALVTTAEIAGWPETFIAGTTARAARHYSYVGAIDLARAYIDRAPAIAPDEDRLACLQQRVARASIALAEGDEMRATAAVRSGLEHRRSTRLPPARSGCRSCRWPTCSRRRHDRPWTRCRSSATTRGRANSRPPLQEDGIPSTATPVARSMSRVRRGCAPCSRSPSQPSSRYAFTNAAEWPTPRRCWRVSATRAERECAPSQPRHRRHLCRRSRCRLPSVYASPRSVRSV